MRSFEVINILDSNASAQYSLKQDIYLSLTGRAEPHITVIPVEYAHAQNVRYVQLLAYDTIR